MTKRWKAKRATEIDINTNESGWKLNYPLYHTYSDYPQNLKHAAFIQTISFVVMLKSRLQYSSINAFVYLLYKTDTPTQSHVILMTSNREEL